MQNAYFHGFIFSQFKPTPPPLYSNPKKPKSPRIKIIGGLVSSSDWNEVCMEEPQLLAGFPRSSLIPRKKRFGLGTGKHAAVLTSVTQHPWHGSITAHQPVAWKATGRIGERSETRYPPWPKMVAKCLSCWRLFNLTILHACETLWHY